MSVVSLIARRLQSHVERVLVVVCACVAFAAFCESAAAQATLEWSATQTDAGSNEVAYVAAVAPDGSTYVATRVRGAPVYSDPNYDARLTKFTSAGALEWSVEWDTYGLNDSVTAMLVAPGGELYVAGSDKRVTPAGFGNLDATLRKFAPDGTQQWFGAVQGSAASGWVSTDSRCSPMARSSVSDTSTTRPSWRASRAAERSSGSTRSAAGSATTSCATSRSSPETRSSPVAPRARPTTERWRSSSTTPPARTCGRRCSTGRSSRRAVAPRSRSRPQGARSSSATGVLAHRTPWRSRNSTRRAARSTGVAITTQAAPRSKRCPTSSRRLTA